VSYVDGKDQDRDLSMAVGGGFSSAHVLYTTRVFCALLHLHTTCSAAKGSRSSHIVEHTAHLTFLSAGRNLPTRAVQSSRDE